MPGLAVSRNFEPTEPTPTATSAQSPTPTNTPLPTPTSTPSANLIANPGFESGTASWTFYTDASGNLTTVTSGAYEGSRSGRVHITTAGTNVQLYQIGISLTAGRRYRLSFAAKSSTGHDLDVKIHKHSTWVDYGLNQTVNLSASWQVFTYDFTAVGFSGTTTDTRLRFDLSNYDANGDDYSFDSISLTDVGLGARPGGKVLAALAPARALAPLLADPPPGVVWRSYYYAGGQRVAMRVQGDSTPANNGVFYLLGDHLGSTSITANSDGTFKSELRYKAWGEVRYANGNTPTSYRYTGQRQEQSLGGTDGLYYYGARFYDPSLGRFAQADPIVPNLMNITAFDRYAYVLNNPVKYIDPTGHDPCNNGSYNPMCPPSNSRDYSSPTPVNETLLDREPGEKTGISGYDFYQWYLSLYNTRDGWWYGMFGEDGDGFTIWDAFAVIYVFEAQYNWTDPNLSEAALRDANGWCWDQKGTACTIENYINHFAHEYQSAGNYVRSGFPPNPYDVYPSFNSEAAQALRRVAASFVNHPSDWNEGCKWDQPCGWANRSMYRSDVQTKLDNNQNALFTYTPSDPSLNPWIIPSWCVVYNWMGGSGEINLDIECPIVR